MIPYHAWLFISVVMVTVSCSTPTQEEGSDLGKPNIVFILADDMGYGDPGVYNQDSKVPTPYMDRLAQEGVRFTDAHTPSSVCTPTRYALLTGRYAWRTRLKAWVLSSWEGPLIEPDRLTVPSFLKQFGYDTAMFGKWHLGWDWPTTDGIRPKRHSQAENVDFSRPIRNGPIDSGFDYYFGVDLPNLPPYCYIENNRTVGIPTEHKPKHIWNGDYDEAGPMMKGWNLTNILPDLTAKVVNYIDQQAENSPRHPFFLYFSLTAPHTPIVPAPQFVGRSQAGPYGDFVHQVDWTVGQVMKALERNGLAKDTLILVTSDNGSPARDGKNMGGEIGAVTQRYGHHPNDPLRGMKADIWDGGHRVPFIARWPGRIPPNTTSDETICLVDLMATCAAILGEKLPANAGEDSYNILPALLGERLDKPIREATVHHSGGGMFALRQGPWKLILGRGPAGFSGPEIQPGSGEPPGQLYNLAEDLAETRNLFQEQPEIVERLTRLLYKYKNEGRSRPLH